MHYDTSSFDADNTLLDFDVDGAESFRGMLKKKGEPFPEGLFSIYKTMDRQMWWVIERGEATMSEMSNTRFSRLMSEYGKQVDGMEWENCYRSYLNHGIQEVSSAHQILKQLKEKFCFYVITNGAEGTQHYRSEGTGMMEHFDGIFISQSIGTGKPTREFLDYVKEHIENFDVGHSLIIGDSLTSDILGGQMVGMGACWFCKEGSENLLDGEPTYAIHDLQDLPEILERQEQNDRKAPAHIDMINRGFLMFTVRVISIY